MFEIASEAVLHWSCRNHPELLTRVYGTPVFDLAGKQQNAERYRNNWDPISIFDNSAKSTPCTCDLLNAPTLTHQSVNNDNNFKPD